MPIYEYRTESGRTFELFFRRADDASETATDPATGETGTRIISGAGFAFKGSGFYLTDYGKNAHRSTGSAPAKGAGESGGTPSGGTEASASGTTGGESKPAAPSTPAPSAPASTPKKAGE